MTAPDERAAVMDYPAAWAFTRASQDSDHDPRCSWIQARMLCDCRVIWNEYERRKRAPLAPERPGEERG